MTDREHILEPDGGFATEVGHPNVGTPTCRGRRILLIARSEYTLAIRGRWAIGLTAVFAVFALGMTTFSGAEVAPAGYERTVASLAALAVYLVPLAALAFGFDAIVGREETGWLHALFALPISRWQVVVGMFLGRATVLAGATVIGFGSAGALLLREFGMAGWQSYVWFTFVAVGAALAFLGIGCLVSAIAGEKAHALGMVLILWAWFVLIYDLLALGVIAAFRLPDLAITALVLGNPAGIFRVLALSGLETGGAGGYSAAFATNEIATGILVVGLLVWIFMPLGIAGVLVRRRSL